MSTLKQDIQAWRGSTAENGGNQSNLLSKLQIGESLYSIKDPAVEGLAELVETRLSALETATVRATALTKESEAKFATSVTQGVDGQISVEYANVRATALEDTAVDGQFVTTVSQGVDGQISIARAGVTAGQVGFSATDSGFTASTVAGALDALFAADKSIIGESTDGSTVISIYGARAYADYVANQLAGTDWSQNAQTIQNIIAELEGSTATAGWSTLVDKLSGMTYVNDGATVTASTVAEYVEARIAAVNAANAEGIEGLDATVGSTVIAADKHVAVQVTEVDGKLTDVTVVEDDIASATALAALDTTAVKSVNGATGNTITLTGADIALSGSTATKLDAYITAVESAKANKAAITTDTIDEWGTPTYTAGSETLTWTSTGVTVYVPASGETL
jgi:hypothetical protein